MAIEGPVSNFTEGDVIMRVSNLHMVNKLKRFFLISNLFLFFSNIVLLADDGKIISQPFSGLKNESKVAYNYDQADGMPLGNSPVSGVKPNVAYNYDQADGMPLNQSASILQRVTASARYHGIGALYLTGKKAQQLTYRFLGPDDASAGSQRTLSKSFETWTNSRQNKVQNSSSQPMENLGSVANLLK